MQKYDPQQFIDSVTRRLNGREIPNCPFCGGQNYTSTEDFSAIIIGKELDNITLGPNVPSGMLICKNCGHIDFFALGVLGLLPTKGEPKDGSK